MMTELVEQARRMAQLGFVNSRTVEELFSSSQDGNRIVALGLMWEKLNVQFLASSPKLFGDRVLILNSIKRSAWPKI